jgi:hypothetical protein
MTSFADDANGQRTFSISFQYSILKNDVANCIDKVANWMNENFLKVNQEKTELILFHPKSMEHQVIIGGTFIGKECIRFSKAVKNVGVTLDNNLTLEKHVNNIVSYSFKLLKNIGRIRNIITKKQTEMLVHAVTTSRLDYCNSLFVNMNKANLFKLQKVQNAAARLVVRKTKRQSVARAMKELHWLRVESRIIFKILLMVYKCVKGQCSENLKIKYKMYNCRQQDYLQLQTKSVNTKHGKRTFDYVGPRLWNSLPPHMRMEDDIEAYKKQLKTLLFEGTDEMKKRAFMYD